MKIEVLYVGRQTGFEDLYPGPMHLVNEPSGTTKVFDSKKHKIVGIVEYARKYGIKIPAELIGLSNSKT